MTCAVSFIKCLMVVGNLLAFLSGAALLGIGVFTQALSGESKVALESLPIALIVLGAVLMLVSCFGCCGANLESRVLLGVFFFLVLLLIGAQIGVGVLAVENKNSLNDTLHTGWSRLTPQTQNITQYEFSCCGYYAPNDSSVACPANVTQGCYPVLRNLLHRKLIIVEISALALAGVELLALLLAGLLICYLPARREDERQSLLRQAKAINREYA